MNIEEYQYLNLIRTVIDQGVYRNDRTGTGTKSIFGCQMRFSLRDSTLPLITTKKVFWRGVLLELLWFISGSTDANILSNKGVKIWDGHGSREFLDKMGFYDRQEGDLGPIYGFQWRHYGAQYIDSLTDYSNKGIDQLQESINLIRNDPNSRRIIINSWNPSMINQMSLPPCHVMCQFYVANGELSCMMYQRSCDIGLGVPFNIASYSLLTHMIAHICDLNAGDLIYTLGDAHIYTNHIEHLQLQLQRIPRPFPKLNILRKVNNIDDFTYNDFRLIDYNPYEAIKMEMAI